MSSTRIAAALAALVLTAAGLAAPVPARAAGGAFDLQAHRGGIGLRPENTLASFGNALRLGVSTLELDVQITKDGQAVVTHDRRVDARKCKTEYAGRSIKDLTLAQVRTFDCGSPDLPDFPAQVDVPGARMPLLREVFDLVKKYRASGVKLNVETKVEAGAPEETAPRAQFVHVTANEVRRAGLIGPEYFFGPAVPVLQRRWGLKVVPYTINDQAIMQRLIDLGVDGFISDDPDTAVLVARRNGLR